MPEYEPGWLANKLLNAALEGDRAKDHDYEDLAEQEATKYLKYRDLLFSTPASDSELEYIIAIFEPEVAGKPWPRVNAYDNIVTWAKELLEASKKKAAAKELGYDLDLLPENIAHNWDHLPEPNRSAEKFVRIGEYCFAPIQGPHADAWSKAYYSAKLAINLTIDSQSQALYMALNSILTQALHDQSIRGTYFTPRALSAGQLVSLAADRCRRWRLSPDPSKPYTPPFDPVAAAAALKPKRFWHR